MPLIINKQIDKDSDKKTMDAVVQIINGKLRLLLLTENPTKELVDTIIQSYIKVSVWDAKTIKFLLFKAGNNVGAFAWLKWDDFSEEIVKENIFCIDIYDKKAKTVFAEIDVKMKSDFAKRINELIKADKDCACDFKGNLDTLMSDEFNKAIQLSLNELFYKAHHHFPLD